MTELLRAECFSAVAECVWLPTTFSLWETHTTRHEKQAWEKSRENIMADLWVVSWQPSGSSGDTLTKHTGPSPLSGCTAGSLFLLSSQEKFPNSTSCVSQRVRFSNIADVEEALRVST